MSGTPQYNSDVGILENVARGTENAMDECMKKYGGLIWSIAQRYVKDRSSAEDVVQEIFTDLWKSAKRFNPDSSSEATFVGLLARRRSIDYLRKESRRPLLEPLPESDDTTQATIEPSPAMQCESQDIRSALAQLPKETQIIFSLHFDQGMTHPEIVEKTGLPLGTVKTRLRRGLIEMRNKMQHSLSDQSLTTAAS